MIRVRGNFKGEAIMTEEFRRELINSTKKKRFFRTFC